jgi:diguanylate cyclase (GGDEF)-like protein
LRVLFADDSRTLRSALSEQLRGMRHEVIEAQDGREAVALFQAQSPDLVILDVDMPLMDGYATARAIRALAGDHGWIPIIFLSGNVQDADVANGIDAGGDDYLTKPVSAVVLRAKINAMQRITDMRARLIGLSRELAQINASLREESTLDSLTGIPNRRAFDAAFEQEWNHAERGAKPLAVILGDVDHFKRYNDTYGHGRGDEGLKRVASALRQAVRRKVDVVARYGGEEFAMLLPDTSAVSALLVAGNVLQGIRALRLLHSGSATSDHLTISLGVCSGVPKPGKSPADMMRVADRALYEAKSKGRNQAVLLSFE